MKLSSGENCPFLEGLVSMQKQPWCQRTDSMQTKLQCHSHNGVGILLSWKANNYLIILFTRPKSSSIYENNDYSLCIIQKPYFVIIAFQIKDTSIPPSPGEMSFIWSQWNNASPSLSSVAEWVNISRPMATLENIMPLSFFIVLFAAQWAHRVNLRLTAELEQFFVTSN